MTTTSDDADRMPAELAATAAAGTIPFTVVNHSTVVEDAAVDFYITGQQAQVDEDFGPAWRVGGIKFERAAAPRGLPGEMVLVIADDSDQAGALGYHETLPTGTPIGYVFAKTDLHYNLSWTVTASHEVLEMLADPFIMSGANVSSTSWLAIEVCDAVEADAYAYTKRGVLVSAFVLPAWFIRGAKAAAYSFPAGIVKAPMQLAKGGYIGKWQLGRWTQVVAKMAEGQTASRSMTMNRMDAHVRHSVRMATGPVTLADDE